MDVLFIGGTGQISLPCVEAAVGAGHRVAVFNRGHAGPRLPDGVESIVGDMGDATAYGALARRRFDVVCQFEVFTPEQMATDIAVFTGHAGHYIFISSASVYEKPPRHYLITEQTPTINPYWAYSQSKIACEALLKAQQDLKFTIVRPSHTVRVGLPSMLGEGDAMAERLLAGKPVLLAGDGTGPWTLTRAVDFAKPFVGLFGKPAALGTDFHITGNRGFSWDAITRGIARGLGVEAHIVHVPTEALVRYHQPWTGPLLGDKSWPALFDNSKVKGVAGDFACAEDLDTILADSISNFRHRRDRHGPVTSELDSLMDRIAAEQSALGRIRLH